MTHELNAFAAGQGRRLMRMVGACKEGTEDYFKPTTFFDSKVPLHPFHDHIFTFLKGTETDVTTMFPVEPLP